MSITEEDQENEEGATEGLIRGGKMHHGHLVFS